MGKTLTIDEDECTSCSQCADSLPEVFEMNDDDISTVKKDWAEADEEDIQEEIDTCPGECIHWKKD